jgi:hypothetical protein
VAQLGANAHARSWSPGRVPDCYLGLRLDPDGDEQAAGVLVLALRAWPTDTWSKVGIDPQSAASAVLAA